MIEPGFIETQFGANVLDHRGEPGPVRGAGAALGGCAGGAQRRPAAPGPELVASVIADALESEREQLRWPVGADAEMVAAARESMSYDDFLVAMRQVLGLDW